MQVKSLESDRIEKLSILDKNHANYAQDRIGNAGGLDSDIVLCEDTGDYVTKSDKILDFWVAYCEREQASGEGLEVARSIGLDDSLELFNGIDSDIEENQACFLNNVKDALEDGELLGKLEISQSEAEEAHEKVTELLNRDCFK